MLSSWIWLTLSFGNFPICLILIWIVSCTFINCLCSCRWKALCLHKYSFYICCHPLASTSSTWKLFLCKRKQVKIVIISPYESKEAWDIWLFLKNWKGHINKTHWQSCLYLLPCPDCPLPLFCTSFSYLLVWRWNLIVLIREISSVKAGSNYLLQGANS